MARHPIGAIGLAVLMLFATGCTIEHKVADDYTQYLDNNEGQHSFPSTGMRASYAMLDDTGQHRHEFRSWMAGYANLWIVEFGKILEATLQSKDVQDAFTALEPADVASTADDVLTFSLEDYAFVDSSARITLHVSMTSDGESVLDKAYTAQGKSQGGKMFWGGVFAMKNAIHQSTKAAMDDILGQLITDLGGEPSPALSP